MPELTSEQIFIVRRLATKIGAAKHHLRDAANAAKYTSPEVLAQAGIADAVEMLRGCLRDLEVALRPVAEVLPASEAPQPTPAPGAGEQGRIRDACAACNNIGNRHTDECGRCSVCGSSRVRQDDGSLGACGFLQCPDPTADHRREDTEATAAIVPHAIGITEPPHG